MTDPGTAERRGRMLTTRTVVLTLDELGLLLTAAAHRSTDPGTLPERLWLDLATVDPDLAEQTWRNATTDGAHPATVVAIAALLGDVTTTQGDHQP